MTLLGRSLGQYQVLEELGRGKRAVMYKVWQRSLERHMSLKAAVRVCWEPEH
jgi:hypothetical protein